MSVPALEIAGLSKRFGGALALDGVSLTVARGEVHGLLGSNGSGKSTLIKVLAGFHAPEPGARLALYGRDVPLPIPPGESQGLGLAFVHQHLGLIPALSVTENLRLSRLATEGGWALSWPALHAGAAAVFARYGLALDPRAPVAGLSASERALLAIVRAAEDLSHATAAHADRPGILVLDEPTPFLPRAGVEQLFALVRQVTTTGASVIFVSHDVDEVREITDRATILRDGRLIETVTTAATSHEGFVSRIVGRRLAAYERAHVKHLAPGAPVLARVEGLAAPGVGPLDLTLRAGEILGLTGLVGSGADRVPGLLYAGGAGVAGRLRLDGTDHALGSVTPAEALARGIAYLPADRLGAAGVGALPVSENVALPVHGRLRGRFGLSAARIRAHAARLCAEAGVKPADPALPLQALSGGNAQKAVLAKWLQTEPRLLLLDEPTQGVDVGARQQIWEALDATADRGAAVVVASTDYDQLAQICHRVLVFARGRVAEELPAAALSKEAIAEACFRSTARTGAAA